MENITHRLAYMLKKKLSIYRELNELLVKEREAIVNIDVDALWQNAGIKKTLAKKIQELRQEILTFLEAQSGVSDMDTRTFSLSYLLRTLPVAAENISELREIKLEIDHEKDLLTQTAFENKKYVNEYMSVIDEIMAVAADNSAQSQYTQGGRVTNSKAANCLIHAKV